MPVTYAFQHGVLIVSAIGDYVTAELTGAMQAALADPGFGRGVPILLDARSSLTYLSPDEIERRVEWFAGMCRQGYFPRIAFLAPEDSFRGRITASAVVALGQRGVAARIFADREEALRWLRDWARESDARR